MEVLGVQYNANAKSAMGADHRRLLLTALSKGVVFGLLWNRRCTSGVVPEYERVGFINGLDEIGNFVEWDSNSHSAEPLFEKDWGPDENEGSSSRMVGLEEVK